MKQRAYQVQVDWIGNSGEGTSAYRSYVRDHIISVPGKPQIAGSSDPAFRGDPSRYNPEELLLASLSSCHMLWYLHLCSVNRVIVLDYRDSASGTLQELADGSGEFVRAVLKPIVTISGGCDPLRASLFAQRGTPLLLYRQVSEISCSNSSADQGSNPGLSDSAKVNLP